MQILIADDNERVRNAVAQLVSAESGWHICGHATDGNEAVKMTQELRPDVILLDVSMPRLSGLEAARLIRAQTPGTRILVMSQHDPLMLLPRAIEAGADACVDKSRLGLDLVPAIARFEEASKQKEP
jgi:DNA-binding NarL/FixJ family response regulator